MLIKKLQQLVKDVPCQIIGNAHTLVTDITNDSRKIQPGSMFFAIKGYKDDGRRYIDQGLKQGMAVLVTDEYINCPVTQVITTDIRKAQSLIACSFFGHPGQELQITGITGTNGKSTSTFLIDSILRAQALKTGLIGTLYNKLDDEIRSAQHTTPDSIECQKLLRQMANKQISHVTMEVSSHAMVMERVTGIPFTVGGLTNFSPDHLDLHKDMEDYFQAKKKFFDTLSPQAIALVNADDRYSEKMIRDCKAQIITYGIEAVADIMLTSQAKNKNGSRIEMAITRSLNLPWGHTVETGEIETTLQLPGRHNIYNALLAAGAALSLGVQVSAVAAGITRFDGLFRRCEEIWQGQYRVIDDATHNPGNMNAIFETVTDPDTKFVVVYGIRGSRGVDINRELANTLASWSRKLTTKKIIFTNCSDTASPADFVTQDEERVFKDAIKSAHCKLEFTERLRDAVAEAVKTIGPGDTLLLMGAHPMDNVAEIFAREAGVEIVTQPRPPAFGS